MKTTSELPNYTEYRGTPIFTETVTFPTPLKESRGISGHALAR